MQTDSFLYFCRVISKNKIKLVRALETKKGREKQGLFVAEGPKVVGDLLAAGFELVELFEEEEDIHKESWAYSSSPKPPKRATAKVKQLPKESSK